MIRIHSEYKHRARQFKRKIDSHAWPVVLEASDVQDLLLTFVYVLAGVNHTSPDAQIVF